jgi:hypothetical protein
MQLQENFVKKKVSVVKGTAGFHTRVFSAASPQKASSYENGSQHRIRRPPIAKASGALIRRRRGPNPSKAKSVLMNQILSPA